MKVASDKKHAKPVAVVNGSRLRVRSIRIWASHRGRGSSWGLEYPMVFGFIEGFGSWMVWERHTGNVAAVFPHTPNVHGWSQAERLASEFSKPAEYDKTFNNFELDAVA